MKKVIFITGVSSGIGHACAQYLTLKGHIVYGTMRQPVNQALPYSVIQMDVTDKASINKAVQYVLEKETRIDVLINNAGLALGRDFFEEADLNDWEIMIDTNIKGFLYVAKAVAKLLKNYPPPAK